MSAARPLDAASSIKVKLGVLVAVSVSVSALALWFALLRLGWWPRYVLPVTVLLALAVTQVLACGMTSPLREMTAAARAMAGGDYSRRVRATSRDEVGELARAFNRMAEDLGGVDRARRDLVANVSHELRTPVAALQAVMENLVDGVTEPDTRTLHAALAQTERLGRLVQELLDLSRVDAGDVPLSPADLPLRAVLDEVTAQARMSERPVAFEVDLDPPDLRIWADGDRLHQVLANLLDNASRHCPPGGTVRIGARPQGGGVRLWVDDDGPGIAPADRSRVFERFHRGSGAGEGDGGTGLGLAIARWAVDLHGGGIAVDAAAGGSRIVIDLPGRSS